MVEPDSESTGGGAEPPDDAWPQLERRDWSTRPADAAASAPDVAGDDTAPAASDGDADPDGADGVDG